MEPEEHEESGSLKKKVATGVAVGLASTAAAGVAKKLLTNDDGDEAGDQATDEDERRGGQGSPSGRTRSSAGTPGSVTRSTSSRQRSSSGTRGRAKTQAKAKAKSSSTRSASTRRGGERTKEQLYNQAKRLGIEGRSKMSKAQLERAVARARS